MKLLLVFDDWKDENGFTIEAMKRAIISGHYFNALHSGATFAPDDLPREEIEAARAKGFYPVFRVVWKEDETVKSDLQMELSQWQRYASYCRSCALCGSEPDTFDAFVKHLESFAKDQP